MGRKRLTTGEFVKRALLVHGNKYDYSNVDYVDKKSKVCIICPIHGEFLQKPLDHLNGSGCKKCGVAKRTKKITKTKDDFIFQAKCIHGEKYDYSMVDYVNNKTNVKIFCKDCGEIFEQTPIMHLRGRGCRVCGTKKAHEKTKGKGNKNARKILFGVGIVEYDGNVDKLLSYRRWYGMLTRCYDKKYQAKKPTYKGCNVCDEWLRFSNFKAWFDANYIDGYVLDKDIIVKGNKLYSPDTCCFVPATLNSLLTKRDFHRGIYPIGVQKPQRSRFLASIHLNGTTTKIGRYDTIKEAFFAYKQTKEAHIKEVAKEYFDKKMITEKVYNALINYKVEITD